MRLIYVSRWFPVPANNGARLRVFNTLKQLGQRNEIHLLSFVEQPPDADAHAALLPYCASVQTVPWREFSPRRAKALAGFFSSTPRSYIDSYSAEMQSRLEKMAAAIQPDAVLASQNGCAPYVASLPTTLPTTARIFEELEIGYLYGPVTTAASARGRMRAQITWWKSSSFFRNLLARFDGYTVVSEVERSLVETLLAPQTAVAVVPNGVELPPAPAGYPAPEADALIYAGSPTFAANLDAVRYFAAEILPLIAARRPNVVLRVTGALPARQDDLPRFENRVIYTGNLPDVRPLLASSWASVIPLREGGGTRLKLLESLAVGTPVVSTAKGSEGLELAVDSDYLRADTPAEFAAATVRLLENPALRASLSQHGTATVARTYQWNAVLSNLERFIQARVQARAQDRQTGLAAAHKSQKQEARQP